MHLAVTTTHRPATDLGFLLHKHPDRVHSRELSFGRSVVLFPEASEAACTAVLAVDVDPVALVRDARTVAAYVNDRPYVASSHLSVAIARTFDSALQGRCRDRPELAQRELPLEAWLPTVPLGADADLIGRLFGPLGWSVEVAPLPGTARYGSLRLTGTARLAALLTHLYVLLPVLDGRKHYFVDDDEVEKLLRHGDGWLAAHPDRELITRRYLHHRRSLVRDAIARLAPDAEPDEGPEVDEPAQAPLHQLRLQRVRDVLVASGARSVLDLGCGEGQLLRLLQADAQFERIVGYDVAVRSLERAAKRLRLDRPSLRQAGRIELMHGSLVYRDRRLAGFDAAAAVEVVEHLDPARLHAFEEALFATARPRRAVLTTPNVEYNVRYPTLTPGRMRHGDHRFEWTRAQFTAWAIKVAARYGYSVDVEPIGEVDADVGSPSQMATFRREGDR